MRVILLKPKVCTSHVHLRGHLLGLAPCNLLGSSGRVRDLASQDLLLRVGGLYPVPHPAAADDVHAARLNGEVPENRGYRSSLGIGPEKGAFRVSLLLFPKLGSLTFGGFRVDAACISRLWRFLCSRRCLFACCRGNVAPSRRGVWKSQRGHTCARSLFYQNAARVISFLFIIKTACLARLRRDPRSKRRTTQPLEGGQK